MFSPPDRHVHPISGQDAPGSPWCRSIERAEPRGSKAQVEPLASGAVPPFENVHLYNALAAALGIRPSPNDGDPEVAHRLLASHPGGPRSASKGERDYDRRAAPKSTSRQPRVNAKGEPPASGLRCKPSKKTSRRLGSSSA
jgi:hypothetical protein